MNKMVSFNPSPPVSGLQATPSGARPDPARIKILIVIPVYNHAATLRNVVIQALQVHKEVLVVDDGSIDDAAGLLQGLNMHLIRHPRNLGKGAAIITAAREARRLGMTHIATIDADGQHNPKEFKRFLPLIEEAPDAIIVGKRDFEHADVPRANRLGRGISNFWLRLQTGRNLGDAQSGFRVYPLWVLEGLKLVETRYTFEIEVLVKAAWAGVELLETDISVYYPRGEERVTHFHLFWDNLRLSRLNAKLTLRSFLPWPHRKILDHRKKGSEAT
jgi:glycosyltransferase involved in cell wall biosynthesis